MPAFSLRHALTGLAVVAIASLAGCGGLRNASTSVAGIVTPYKAEVVQGNFVSKEQVAYLQPGATRQQVRDVLGTPLLSSAFHADRWDYVFTIRRQGVEPQARRLTLYFKGDLLERFEGDEMPSEAEFVASLDSRRKNAKVPVLEATEEQLQKSARPATPAAGADATAAATPAPAAPTAYPPLESSRR